MQTEHLKVKEINDLVNNIGIQEYPLYISLLLQDARESVKKIGKKMCMKYKQYLLEQERVQKLWLYEKNLFNRGYNLVAGIDEAGRGPLAGPVVAAAVILPHNLFIEGINDSKKLSKIKRDQIYDIIIKNALSVGIGVVDNKTIDEINILKATQLAMSYAVKKLSISPEYLLIDAIQLGDIHIKQNPIIEGDSKSISIAAASIVAKVTRDKMMEEFDKIYPQYGFGIHKGYGTKKHYENIKKYGITSIHRRSFLKNIVGDV